MRSKRLTQQQKKEIFHELVKSQDEGLNVRKSYQMLTERFAITEAQLRQISCPVDLVWGELDTVAPLSVAEAALRVCPDASLTVCPGAGHLTLTAAPACIRGAVERRLQPA